MNYRVPARLFLEPNGTPDSLLPRKILNPDKEPKADHAPMNEPRVRAPQWPSNPDLWLNAGGKALSLPELKGCVVLLNFWTYGCIHCLRALPDLEYLERKYAGRSLVVIGVHSGKFDNENNAKNTKNQKAAASRENLTSALQRCDIRRPVLQDDAHTMWQAYGVHAWPTFVLIDPEGYDVGSVSGEGQRDTLDKSIARLLDAYRSEGNVRGIVPRLEPDAPPAADLPLRFPGKILADAGRERLFIADTGHNRIVMCDLDGLHVQTVGSGKTGCVDGDFATARFAQPQGMALVGDVLWVCDCANHLLRRLDLRRQTATTAVGTGVQAAPRQTGGEGLKTPLSSPWGLCYNQAEHGQMYIAMAGANQVYRYDLQTGAVVPFAGTGREARIDGPAAQSAFVQPSGITTDGKNLYVADTGSSSLRRVELGDKPFVETLSGGDLFAWGDVDGQGENALLQHPLDVACQGSHVYIADTYNHKIKTVSRGTLEFVTLAGTGQSGMANGEAAQSLFYEPGGVSVAGGKLYIADTNNHLVRVLDLETGIVSTLEIAGLRPPIAETPSRRRSR